MCGEGWGGGPAGRGQALAAIPGAAIFSPIDEAASATQPGFRRRQWARVTVPARPPGEASPGLGRRCWRLRGRGARSRPELGAGGVPGGGGRGAAVARLQEREAAAAEQWGPPRGVRDPRPPGHGRSYAAEPLPAGGGATPEGGGGEASQASRARGGGRGGGSGGPGKGAVCAGAWQGSGPRRESRLETGGRGGRDLIPGGTGYIRVSPRVWRPALSRPSPPRVGFGPRGALEVARPEEFLPFPRWLPGVRELGCQDAEPGGTRVARCNPFVGLSREAEPGEGLVESGADLGLEVLQRWHLQWFPVE